MAGLALVPSPSEQAWVDLDREWTAFWEGLQAHAADPAAWFTPERSGKLQELLRQGQAWLREHPHPHPERDLYACHLRRLLPVLYQLQAALEESAAKLQAQQHQLDAARAWAGSLKSQPYAAAPAPAPRPAPAKR
jgi:hypothetical protein